MDEQGEMNEAQAAGRASRRQVLAGMGLLGAAGAAGVLGVTGATAAGAAAVGGSRAGTNTGGATSSGVIGDTITPATPGVVYSTVSGYALQPLGNPSLVDRGLIGVGPDASVWCNLFIPVPHGATVKEVHLFASGGLSLGLKQNLTGTYAWNSIATVATPAGTGVQHGSVTNLNFINDTSAFSLFIGGQMGTADEVQSAAIGYIPAAPGFHPLTPARVYDSRWNPAPAGVTTGPLVAPNARVVSVADGRSLTTGAINAANLVPAGASAITYNLTVVPTTATGFLAITPGNAPSFAASAINWNAVGQPLANGGVVTLDSSRQVKLFANGGTDFIVDVTGYYL